MKSIIEAREKTLAHHAIQGLARYNSSLDLVAVRPREANNRESISNKRSGFDCAPLSQETTFLFTRHQLKAPL